MSDDKLQKLSDLKAIEERAVPVSAARVRLRELSGDADASVRGPAVALAGAFPGDDELVAVVLEVSRTDAEAEVRGAALLALGEVLEAGELAGAEFGAYAPDPELNEPSSDHYREAQARLLTALEANGTERTAALLGLAPLFGRLEAVVRAIDADLEGDAAARAGALEAVARTGSARWAGAIRQGLADEDSRVARSAALAAGAVELADAAGELTRLLREGPALARAGAATALGRLQGREAAGVLWVAAERDSEDVVRQAARLALADLELLAEGGAV